MDTTSSLKDMTHIVNQGKGNRKQSSKHLFNGSNSKKNCCRDHHLQKRRKVINMEKQQEPQQHQKQLRRANPANLKNIDTTCALQKPNHNKNNVLYGAHPLHSIPATRPHTSFLLSKESYVALDCEMVGVGPGGSRSVLARASVVDYNGRCLLDTFVRVEERVTDYRTFVSGIRPEDLCSPNAISFGECRKQVQRVLQGKILVGHAVHNDLEVMRLCHPWYYTRDTSIYEPFMKFDRYGNLCQQKLRHLVREHLGRSIQQNGTEHDSLIDACAAMDLFKLVETQWEYEIELQRRNLLSFPQSFPMHSFHKATTVVI